jgi:hypothetical protein
MLRASLWMAGAWLGFLVASWIMATANFQAAERVAGRETRAEVTARLGAVAPEDRRVVLRHLASEINRFMFRTWSAVQLVLGFALLALAWRLGGAARALAGAALVLVLVQAFGLAGPIAALGRTIDFVPRPLPPDVGRRFGMLHGAYVIADLVKAVALLAFGIVLLRRP